VHTTHNGKGDQSQVPTIALIGRGYWGSKLLRYLKTSFVVKHVADSKTDLSEIWNDSDVDGVIVATPIDTHYHIVRDALSAGKHVYSEKPLTLSYESSTELINIAEENGVYLGVEYTLCFSPTVQEIVTNLDLIGDIEYIHMSSKHLGRFMNYDVYWLLASHHLSILDMIVPLDELSFQKKSFMTYNNLVTTGRIEFTGESIHGDIDVSTNHPGKELGFTIYGARGTIGYRPLDTTTGFIIIYDKIHAALPKDLTTMSLSYQYDEKNNLHYSIEYFRDLIRGTVQSNMWTAAKISKILQGIEPIVTFYPEI